MESAADPPLPEAPWEVRARDLPLISVAETLGGAPGRVDLWFWPYEDGDSDDPASYEGLLSADECARRDRFHFARDRRLFVATRVLVRTVLSRYAPVAPASWRFERGDQGKPRIATAAAPLHFNLANTHGLVVCAVSVAHEGVGVDAEGLARESDLVPLADHYFAPFEVTALRALPEPDQQRRFFTYWTLKESYLKARGLGLGLPLDQFWFELDGRIGISFDPRLVEEPGRWQFALVGLESRYLMAVALDSGGAPLSLRAALGAPDVVQEMTHGHRR